MTRLALLQLCLVSILIVLSATATAAAARVTSSSSSSVGAWNYTYTFIGSPTSDALGWAAFTNISEYRCTDRSGHPVPSSPSSPSPPFTEDARIVIAPLVAAQSVAASAASASSPFQDRVLMHVDGTSVAVHTIESTELTLIRSPLPPTTERSSARRMLTRRQQSSSSISSTKPPTPTSATRGLIVSGATNTQLTVTDRWIITANSSTHLVASLDFRYGTINLDVPVIQLQQPDAAIYLSGLQLESLTDVISSSSDDAAAASTATAGTGGLHVTGELRIRAHGRLSLYNASTMICHNDATVYLSEMFGEIGAVHFYDSSQLHTVTNNKGTGPTFICDDGGDIWFHDNSSWHIDNASPPSSAEPQSFPVYSCDVFITNAQSSPLEFGSNLRVDDGNDATIMTASTIILHGLVMGPNARLTLQSPVMITNDGSFVYEPSAEEEEPPYPPLMEFGLCTMFTQRVMDDDGTDEDKMIHLDVDMVWDVVEDYHELDQCATNFTSTSTAVFFIGNEPDVPYPLHTSLNLSARVITYVPLLVRIGHNMIADNGASFTNHFDASMDPYIEISDDTSDTYDYYHRSSGIVSDATGGVRDGRGVTGHVRDSSPFSSMVPFSKIEILRSITIPSDANLTFHNWPLIQLNRGGFHLHNRSHLTFSSSTVSCVVYCQWHTHATDISALPRIDFINTTFTHTNRLSTSMHWIADIRLAADARLILFRLTYIKGHLIGSGLIESQGSLNIGMRFGRTAHRPCEPNEECPYSTVGSPSSLARMTYRVKGGAFFFSYVDATNLIIMGSKTRDGFYTLFYTNLTSVTIDWCKNPINVIGDATWLHVSHIVPIGGAIIAFGVANDEPDPQMQRPSSPPVQEGDMPEMALPIYCHKQYHRWNIHDTRIHLSWPTAFFTMSRCIETYGDGVLIDSAFSLEAFVRVHMDARLIVKNITMKNVPLEVSGELHFAPNGYLRGQNIILNQFKDPSATPTLFFAAHAFSSSPSSTGGHASLITCDSFSLHPGAALIIELDPVIMNNATMMQARPPATSPLIACHTFEVADATINITLVRGAIADHLPMGDIMLINCTTPPDIRLLVIGAPRGEILVVGNAVIYRIGSVTPAEDLFSLLNLSLVSGGAVLTLITIIVCCCCCRRSKQPNAHAPGPLLDHLLLNAEHHPHHHHQQHYPLDQPPPYEEEEADEYDAPAPPPLPLPQQQNLRAARR